MKPALAACGALVIALVLVGCGVSPPPSEGASPSPVHTDALTGDLVGDWQPAPIVLDASHTAIISDACALAVRAQLGGDDASLPTALVDARGAGLATAILADDLSAVQCGVHLDETAQIATVDSVARVSMTAAAAVEGGRVSVASQVADARGGSGGRTAAIGRVGHDAASVLITLEDGAAVVSAVAEGWWAAWWPGTSAVTSYAAIDAQNQVIEAAAPLPSR